MLLKYIVTQLVFFFFLYELLIFEFRVLVCAYAYIFVFVIIIFNVWECVGTLDLAMTFILN